MPVSTEVQVYYTVISRLEFEDMIADEHNYFDTIDEAKEFVNRLLDDGVRNEDITVHKNLITYYYGAEEFMNA